MNITKYNLYLKKDKSFDISFDISNSNKVIEFCKSYLKLDKETQEVLYLIGCDSKNKINSVFEISRGTINKSICSISDIFKRLILSNCNKFVIIHNHFSDTKPSQEDWQVYMSLKETSPLFDIVFNDSLILCDDKYYSFYESQELEYER